MAISPMKSNWVSAFPSTLTYGSRRVSSPQVLSGLKDAQKAIDAHAATLSAGLSKVNSNLFGKKTDYTPESAAKAASEGYATHPFLYHDLDTLAQKAVGEDGAVNEVSSSLARDTLDFFTGGNYTESDVASLQKQLDTALNELGKQVQSSGRVDTTKLKSEINVGGTKMTLSDLADFQTMGQKLVPAFNGITEVSSRFEDMQSTAKMSVARLAAQRFGELRGNAGQMFANAVEGLYNKGMDRVDQLYAESSDLPAGYAQESSDVRSAVSGIFSQIRTSNNSVMSYDFQRSLGGYTGAVNGQYQRFGTPVGYRTAGAAAQQLGMYFNALSRMLG